MSQKFGRDVQKNCDKFGRACKKNLNKAGVNISKQLRKADQATGIKNKKRREKCHAIIHTAMGASAAAAAGMAQTAGADNAVITPIQITMIISLGAVFGIEIQKSTAKGILQSSAAAVTGVAGAKVVAGFFPGFGNAANAIVAGSLTEAIGWKAANDFQKQMWKKHKAKNRNSNRK